MQALPTQEKAKAQRSGGLRPILGGLLAVSAVAAGAFFFVQLNRSPAHIDQPHQVQVATVAPATPKPVLEAVTEAPVVGTDTTASPPDDPAGQPQIAAKANGVTGGGKPSPKRLVLGNDPKATPAAPDVDPSLVAKNLPVTPPADPGSLADHMMQAAGTTPAAGNDPQPAAGPQFEPGTVPQRPSQGAVTGALGAALPAARACLAADSAVSAATVTFGSTGAVTSVSVTGSAAGKPAEGCIKGALSRAKVPPFAQPAYTAKVNVRPN